MLRDDKHKSKTPACRGVAQSVCIVDIARYLPGSFSLLWQGEMRSGGMDGEAMSFFKWVGFILLLWP